MIDSSSDPALTALVRKPFARRDRPRSPRASRVKPMTLVRGVRSSWLILARNSALARAAASLSMRAAASSDS